ncbi:MAG: hypothetical protein GEU91_20110 [Rhizobiales bacterium]|nr:hypothetical protein [Hyphomicrobiales bacterium]
MRSRLARQAGLASVAAMIGRMVLMVAVMMAVPTLGLGADRGDLRVGPKSRVHSSYPTHSAGPYPWSRRAAKIRRADHCWRSCLADAGRDFQACLRVQPPTDCVPWNDVADRFCLRECRLSGGPWVTLE